MLFCVLFRFDGISIITFIVPVLLMNFIDNINIEDTRRYFNSLCVPDRADVQDCVQQTTMLLP